MAQGPQGPNVNVSFGGTVNPSLQNAANSSLSTLQTYFTNAIKAFNGSVQSMAQGFAGIFQSFNQGVVQGMNSGLQQATAATNQLTNAQSASANAIGISVNVWTELLNIIKQVVHAVIDYMKESALLNARNETLGVIMGVVGRNTGHLTGEMERAALAIQQTGITMLESKETVIKLAQSQIDLAIGVKLAKVAQDAATIAQTNSSEALQRLIWGLKTAQPEILRTMGINVNFEQSYKELAKTLNKTASSLTEAEKLTARTNVTFREAAKIAGAYSESMETASKKITSLTRLQEDLKVKIGETFNEALIILVDHFTESLKKNNEVAEQLAREGKLREWGRDVILVLADIVDLLNSAVVGWKFLTATIEYAAKLAGAAHVRRVPGESAESVRARRAALEAEAKAELDAAVMPLDPQAFRHAAEARFKVSDKARANRELAAIYGGRAGGGVVSGPYADLNAGAVTDDTKKKHKSIMAMLEDQLATEKDIYEKREFEQERFTKYSREQEEEFWLRKIRAFKEGSDEYIAIDRKIKRIAGEQRDEAWDTRMEDLHRQIAAAKNDAHEVLRLQEEIEKATRLRYAASDPKKVRSEVDKTKAATDAVVKLENERTSIQDKAQTDAELAAVEGQKRMDHQAYEMKQISFQQLQAQQIAHEQRIFEIKRVAIEKEAELVTYQQDPLRDEKKKAQLEANERAFQERILEIRRTAAMDSMKYELQGIEAVKDAFASLVSGFGDGTKTMKEKFNDFANSLVKSMNDILAKKFVEQLLGAGTQGGSMLGGIMGTLIGTTRGGNSMSRYTPLPAGVSGPVDTSGVGGFFGKIFGGFASGTDYVHETGMYKLHKGESVLRADQQGGQAVTVNNVFHVSGPLDRRSQDQASARVGLSVNRALQRNT